MRLHRLIGWVLATAWLAPQAAGQGVDLKAGWSLNWSAQAPNKVEFRGLPNLDREGGGPQGMMYPAPSAAGFLVAVLTHAVVNEAVRQKQRDNVQAQADQVLNDYRLQIEGMDREGLLERVRADVRRSGFEPGAWLREAGQEAGWSVDVHPIYWMTQDRQALILDAAFSIRERGKMPAVRQLNLRAVSSPKVAGEALDHWKQDLALTAQAAALMGEVVQTLAAELAGQWTQTQAPQRTHRYLEGGQQRIERAELVQKRCGRALLRNLSGDLLWVPLVSVEDEPPCASGAASATEAKPVA